MSEDERVELRGLKLDWSEGRTERLFADVRTRLVRRKLAWRAALSSAALASLVCAALLVARFQHGENGASLATHSPAQQASTRALQLREGSEIKLDPTTSEVRVLSESASRVRVELVRGKAHYAVTPNPARAFEVHTGVVTVTVVGTEFTVEQRGESAWVEVTRGKVRVSWGDSEKERAFVAAGESGLFPSPNAATAAPPVAANSAEPDAENAAPDSSAARAQQAAQAYRSHVEKRDYRGAYAVLAHNPTLAGDTVKDLLVAADVARLSDHPSEAVPYLQRVIREHARDERAPMAAFTLGRTLSGLGRTKEAMSMFAKVRSAWPRSPLAEDALLREAEAASQLGDIQSAVRIAAQYEREYPNGRRRAEVRHYARLE